MVGSSRECLQRPREPGNAELHLPHRRLDRCQRLRGVVAGVLAYTGRDGGCAIALRANSSHWARPTTVERAESGGEGSTAQQALRRDLHARFVTHGVTPRGPTRVTPCWAKRGRVGKARPLVRPCSSPSASTHGESGVRTRRAPGRRPAEHEDPAALPERYWQMSVEQVMEVMRAEEGPQAARPSSLAWPRSEPSLRRRVGSLTRGSRVPPAGPDPTASSGGAALLHLLAEHEDLVGQVVCHRNREHCRKMPQGPSHVCGLDRGTPNRRATRWRCLRQDPGTRWRGHPAQATRPSENGGRRRHREVLSRRRESQR